MPQYLGLQSLYVSLDRAPNILKRAPLRANCKAKMHLKLEAYIRIKSSRESYSAALRKRCYSEVAKTASCGFSIYM